jgi:predicted dehydrogenase
MKSADALGVAVVGCGDISNQYLPHLASFPDVDVVFCADIDPDRARAKAEQYGVAHSGGLDAALARTDVDLVVNLTVPTAHMTIASAALDAGKHVWNEKPLTVDLDDARSLIGKAAANGLRIGCAPDTTLGAGIQTARRLIDSGAIGVPLAANVMMQSMGPDRWHPNPDFFFAAGAGPLFDMGPYYLSALNTLFGSVTRVAGLERRGRDERTVVEGARAGATFPVEVATHVIGLLSYASGLAASAVFSFDSPLHRTGFLEITGTEATLALPDPNTFDGPSRLYRPGMPEPELVPATGTTAGRGIGVVDMVHALLTGRPHRASGELALHVLETMSAIGRSAATGQFVDIVSQIDLPEPVDPHWDPAAEAKPTR